MKNVLFVLVALSAALTLSSQALAGGKNNQSTLRITNSTTTGPIAVLIDKDPATLSAADQNEAGIVRNGGKIIQLGSSADFKVAAGAHTVYVVTVDSSGNVMDIGSKSYTVSRGSRKNVTITDGPVFSN